MDWLYRYPPLYSGILLKRYKRFFADIELASGEVITAHCPNTGPMTGVSQPGSLVRVSSSDNPLRKLRYTWEMIEVNDTEPTWVGINTGLPNKIIKLALERHLFPELGNYEKIYPEVAYGIEKNSRVDFLLTGSDREKSVSSLPVPNEINPKSIDSDRPIYLEVKNTTWAAGKLALFPDTVTTRGQKHLRELTALLPQARAVMLYLINRADCDRFAPGDTADPIYGDLLRYGIKKGLEVLPCRFATTPEGILYLGKAEINF
jgi:sugar fermentation stimulation protein A